MYNIDLYSYLKKPFSRGKNFTIHPLDEPGRAKYFSKDSHCTHYFKRTDPFVFKSILGVDYNTLVSLQKDDIQNLKTFKYSNKLNSNQNKIEKGMHISNEIPTEENEKNKTYDEAEKHENNRYNTYGNEQDFENQKKFRTFYSQKMIRPYHRKRTFKDIYGYENISKLKSKTDKYSNLINNLKFNNLDKENNRYKRKYDGYTIYEIPLINLNKEENNQNNRFFNSKLQNTLNCLNQSKGGKNAMNEEELKKNLFNQTSQEFLKKYKLPDVLKIAGSTQLIRRQKIGLSKEMGEKYNPYSLIPPSKNRIGRNYVGDLFKH